MAQKIPVYGELDCRTAENIIADAEQIRYSDSKNVKEAIDDKMSNPSNTGTVGQVLKKTATGSEWADTSGGGITGFSYCSFGYLEQNTESDAKWNHSFSCAIPSNITPSNFLKKLTILYNVAGHYTITTISTGKDDTYMIQSIQYLQTTKKLRVTILDRDGTTFYNDLDISKMTLSKVDL